MFGLVGASVQELSQPEKDRYSAVYCGICRQIGHQDGQLCRLGLQYDMAFLALLLMSLYEPEETEDQARCLRHPVKPRPWVDNECVRYAARMNVALACYNARDDVQDEGRAAARVMESIFGKNEAQIAGEYPRQCAAIDEQLKTLNRLEQENCPSPDETAACFGRLLGEILVFREDRWADTLRELGFWLGKFIYLADAAMDYRRDKKQGKYNPYVAMGAQEDWDAWDEGLVLAMAACTDAYERLPLVQDKGILDNILYSGVWLNYRAQQKKSRKENHDGRSL